MNGIYIHIPFCKSKCPYCDFYSYRCDDEKKQQYTEAVIDEINSLHRASPYIPEGTFSADTLYIGGGTPSVLKGEQLESIILAARKKFNIGISDEITVECNPSSPIEELIPFFKRCGVNRISLGMQSAVEEERRLLGRSADRKRISHIISILKENGINNISIDVMLGIPKQTKDSLKETLDFIIECDIPHISAYMLKIEEGTFFHTHRERFTFPDDDEVSELYEECCRFLEEKGYIQYEISNFSKPDFHSRHNTKYWLLEDYLGIGPSAHSLINGKRFYYTNSTDDFIKGASPLYDGEGNTPEEYIMLRLRMKDGIDLKKLIDLYGDGYAQRIKEKAPLLAKQGLVYFDEESIRLSKKGYLLSNAVIGEFL